MATYCVECGNSGLDLVSFPYLVMQSFDNLRYVCHERVCTFNTTCDYNYLSFCLKILTPASLGLERAKDDDETEGPDCICGGGIMGRDGSGVGEWIFDRSCLRMGPIGLPRVSLIGGGGLAGNEGCRGAGAAIDVDASDDVLSPNCLNLASIRAILSSVRLGPKSKPRSSIHKMQDIRMTSVVHSSLYQAQCGWPPSLCNRLPMPETR